jgi:hypothetical protein
MSLLLEEAHWTSFLLERRIEARGGCRWLQQAFA